MVWVKNKILTTHSTYRFKYLLGTMSKEYDALFLCTSDAKLKITHALCTWRYWKFGIKGRTSIVFFSTSKPDSSDTTWLFTTDKFLTDLSIAMKYFAFITVLAIHSFGVVTANIHFDPLGGPAPANPLVRWHQLMDTAHVDCFSCTLNGSVALAIPTLKYGHYAVHCSEKEGLQRGRPFVVAYEYFVHFRQCNHYFYPRLYTVENINVTRGTSQIYRFITWSIT